MQELTEFFMQYGQAVTAIALAGIALLGMMKYCNVFGGIAEGKRHYLYIGIAVLFSVVASAVYLAVRGQFTLEYILAIAAAVYALNQAFYNLFKVTPVNELFATILGFVKGLFVKTEK